MAETDPNRKSMEKISTDFAEKRPDATTAEDGRPVEDIDYDPEFTRAEQRKIIHKIDRRLISITAAMYSVSLMDRTNLPNAAVAGMNKELEMEGGFRYSTIALVFFATYTLLQPPATIMCKKIGPRIFLSFLCFSWGVVMIGFGFPKNWVIMIPLRLLLGLFEAGFFPGCAYLISAWYSRFDLQKRYATFYLTGSVVSALSGIFAYGIQQMHGVAGYWGWSWIFIIEGILTVVIAILGYIYLVDFPDKVMEKPAWGFLKQNEMAFVMRRINRDRGDAEAEPWNFKKWYMSGLDWKIWSFAMIFFCLTTMAYALSFFLPIILQQNMNMSVAEAQCLAAPPYLLAAICMGVFAYIGDKYHIRGPLLLVNCVLGLVGLPLLAFAQQPGVRYFGTFLICVSAQGGIPTCLTYQANNIRGHWKRAFASATLIGFGGIGGVAGSLVFRAQDRPHYRPGVYAGIACNVVIVILVCFNSYMFRRENRKADREGKVLEENPEFRYTI